ncbi:MAG: IclR family transcriptional regulator domain-containing protein [Alkalilacustris sp.]
MPSYKPVTSVLRGLEVLRVINRTMPTRVKELHYETGFDKATIVRMLETLIHAGYVARDEATGCYSVVGRVLQLSSGYSAHDRAAEICAPILARFRRAVGWPSDFAVRDSESMIVVQTSRADGPMFFNRRPGFRAPILTTSLGKAYLAFCPQDERAAILSVLQSGPDGTASALPRNLETRLEGIRAAGFAMMDDSYSQSQYGGAITAMAVPVLDGSRLHGAINIMLLREAVSQDEAVERYLPGLLATAADIAGAFRDSAEP